MYEYIDNTKEYVKEVKIKQEKHLQKKTICESKINNLISSCPGRLGFKIDSSKDRNNSIANSLLVVIKTYLENTTILKYLHNGNRY